MASKGATQPFIIVYVRFVLSDQCRYMQDSDGGRKHRTCVGCMQGVCGGFGTRRPSNQEAFGKRAAQCFIILMIRSSVQDVCTLVRLNFV